MVSAIFSRAFAISNETSVLSNTAFCSAVKSVWVSVPTAFFASCVVFLAVVVEPSCFCIFCPVDISDRFESISLTSILTADAVSAISASLNLLAESFSDILITASANCSYACWISFSTDLLNEALSKNSCKTLSACFIMLITVLKFASISKLPSAISVESLLTRALTTEATAPCAPFFCAEVVLDIASRPFALFFAAERTPMTTPKSNFPSTVTIFSRLSETCL